MSLVERQLPADSAERHACTVGVAGWLVSAAAAHSSNVVATIDCSGATSYTATAWAGPTAASRTNGDVRVYASYDGGASFAPDRSRRLRSGECVLLLRGLRRRIGREPAREGAAGRQLG